MARYLKIATAAVVVSLIPTGAVFGADRSCAGPPIFQETPSSTEEFATTPPQYLDDNGVLIYDYGSLHGNRGRWHNPLFVANYGFALYRDYIESGCTDADAIRKMVIQADFLVSNAVDRNGSKVWPYDYAQPLFDLEPGFISGITQSSVAAFLYRAHAVTRNGSYQDTANRALEVYRRPTSDGGVLSNDGDVTWIEEAPHPKRSFRILNGHITALVGLASLQDDFGFHEFDELIRRGFAAVKRDLPLFDAGFTSYYSLDADGWRRFAPRKGYNKSHAIQLMWMHERSKDPVFWDWASRFAAYSEDRDTYLAEGVERETNGPDKANGTYITGSWYRFTAPTWLEVRLDKPASLKQVVIQSPTADKAPRQFKLSRRVDGQWKVVYEATANESDLTVVDMDRSENVEAIKLDITAFNRAGYVTIEAFMPVRTIAPTSSPLRLTPLATQN